MKYLKLGQEAPTSKPKKDFLFVHKASIKDIKILVKKQEILKILSLNLLKNLQSKVFLIIQNISNNQFKLVFGGVK